MDTGLDNANNPFSNSNGADNNIIPQKTEGLLLNLSESFKRNGGDLSPGGDFYHASEKANGKRPASEFDDDDDLGPETDVDTVDDVLSPSIAAAKALAEGIVNNNPDGSFNPFVEKREVEKAALEVDLDLQKQQSSEFDGQRSPREETPTPPADAVHDGGLEENIGDSGEESEDEWNYIKGEEANKENISPTQADCEVADLLEDQENMSQLNPNAAEFVPVSPTRSNPSPACRLMNDPVIAQSPKRPSEIDISLPNPQDFENEVKSRPSDIDPFRNGHDHEDDQKPSAQELMDGLLNGKNIDEIPEFQPGSTPSKTAAEDFHFGPNAAPFTPVKLLDQSEAALSTKAVFGDESVDNLEEDAADFVAKKDDDPMSMSFYQEKADDSLDLNKVQMLPEDIDDFLGKPDEQKVPTKSLLSDDVVLNNDERIQTTDLDKVDDEKELASPVSNDDESSGVCELARSPQPPLDEWVSKLEGGPPQETLPDVCLRPEATDHLKVDTPEPAQVPTPEPAVSPVPQTLSPEPPREPEVCLLPEPKEPEVCPLPAREEPVLTPEPEGSIASPELVLSPEPPKEPVVTQEVEAKPMLSPEPEDRQIVSPEPEKPVLSPEAEERQILSPEPEKPVLSPVPVLSPEPQTALSPEPQTALSPEPEIVAAETGVLSPEPIDVCQMAKSPLEPIQDVCGLPPRQEPVETCNLETERKEIESPADDVTSSVKDITSPPPEHVCLETEVLLNFAQEINNAVVSTVGTSSPVREDLQIPETCPISTPKSPTDTESVATTDVNSFLERSQIAALESPLSPADATIVNHALYKCVYPLPTDLETEHIAPEFAEPVVLSPAKEETPSVPSPPEETVKEPKAEAVVVAEKKTPKAKLAAAAPAKKPAAKPAPKAAASPKAKPLAAKPSPRPAPKARTPVAATTRSSLEKKPLANGDVKAAARTSLAARAPVSKASPAKPPTAAATKASPTKPAAARPTTAPVRAAARPTTAPVRAAATAAATAAKPRPTTLASKTVTSTVAAKTTTRPAVSSPKVTSPPKPRPATAPARPKVPATRTVTKTADNEKLNKDSANKLTASRTVTSTRTSGTATRTTTSTVRKTESKVSGTTRTTLTKTSSTTTRPGAAGKKPQEITRPGAKTTKTTKIEKPVQNGVTTVVTEQITIVNNAVNASDTQLLKDNSPIDNKLLVDTNAAD